MTKAQAFRQQFRLSRPSSEDSLLVRNQGLRPKFRQTKFGNSWLAAVLLRRRVHARSCTFERKLASQGPCCGFGRRVLSLGFREVCAGRDTLQSSKPNWHFQSKGAGSLGRA